MIVIWLLFGCLLGCCLGVVGVSLGFASIDCWCLYLSCLLCRLWGCGV